MIESLYSKAKNMIIILIIVFFSFQIFSYLYSSFNREVIDNKKEELKILVSTFNEVIASLNYNLNFYASDNNIGRNKIAYKFEESVDIEKLNVILKNQMSINLFKYNKRENTIEFQNLNFNYTIKYFPEEGSWFLIISENTLFNNVYPFFSFILYTQFGKSFGIYLSIVGSVIIGFFLNILSNYSFNNYKK